MSDDFSKEKWKAIAKGLSEGSSISGDEVTTIQDLSHEDRNQLINYGVGTAARGLFEEAENFLGAALRKSYREKKPDVEAQFYRMYVLLRQGKIAEAKNRCVYALEDLAVYRERHNDNPKQTAKILNFLEESLLEIIKMEGGAFWKIFRHIRFRTKGEFYRLKKTYGILSGIFKVWGVMTRKMEIQLDMLDRNEIATVNIDCGYQAQVEMTSDISSFTEKKKLKDAENIAMQSEMDGLKVDDRIEAFYRLGIAALGNEDDSVFLDYLSSTGNVKDFSQIYQALVREKANGPEVAKRLIGIELALSKNKSLFSEESLQKFPDIQQLKLLIQTDVRQ